MAPSARLWLMGRPVCTDTGELQSFPELKGRLVFDEKRPKENHLLHTELLTTRVAVSLK